MVGRGKRGKQRKPKKRSFSSFKPTKRTRIGTEAGPAEDPAGKDDRDAHSRSLPNMVVVGSNRISSSSGAGGGGVRAGAGGTGSLVLTATSAAPAHQQHQDHFSLPNSGVSSTSAWKSTPTVFVTPGELDGGSRRTSGRTGTSTKRGRRDGVNNANHRGGQRNTSSTTSSSVLTTSGAPSGDNPDLRRRLFSHCKAGEHEVIKKMLVPGLLTPSLGSQALRVAVDADQVQTTRLLLWAGARESVSPSEVPLLWVAVQHRNLDMLRLLLESGSNVHHAIEGWQALHSACKLGVKPRKPAVSDDDTDDDDSDDDDDDDEEASESNDDDDDDDDEDSDNGFHQQKKKAATASVAATPTAGRKKTVVIVEHKSTEKSRTLSGHRQHQNSKLTGRRSGDDVDDDELDENLCSSAWPFVEALLAAGADVNARTTSGESPLLLAARAGDALSVETLLTAGADPDAYTSINAMHVAAQQNDVAVMTRLANSRCFDVNARTRDKKKWTCFHLAAAAGHTAVSKYLLDIGADPTLQSGDSQLQSPIHIAVEKAHPAIVALLLSRNVPADPQDADGWTPLHLACYHGRDAIVELLRMHHASLESRTSCSDKWLPLHLSTHHNRVVQMLYPRLRDRTAITAAEYEQAIDLPNAHGLTALQSAVVNGHTLAAVTLINRGANIHVRMRKTGHTLLHLACKHGNTVVAETLVLKQGFEIAPLDADSKMPLHLAVAAGHIQTTVLMMRSGAPIDHLTISLALSLTDMKMFFTVLTHDIENLLAEAVARHPQIRSSLVASAISHGFPSLAAEIERYLIELGD